MAFKSERRILLEGMLKGEKLSFDLIEEPEMRRMAQDLNRVLREKSGIKNDMTRYYSVNRVKNQGIVLVTRNRNAK